MLKTQNTYTLSVVQSICGRDKNMMYLVLDTELTPNSERLVLSNGRTRNKDNVKKKNPMHVKFISSLCDEEISLLKKDLSDLNIRAVLAAYDKKFTEND